MFENETSAIDDLQFDREQFDPTGGGAVRPFLNLQVDQVHKGVVT